MFYFIALSILLRAVALVWSLATWRRLRDARLVWLSAVLFFLFIRQASTLIGLTKEAHPSWMEYLAEIFAMCTSVLCLAMVWGLERMILDRDRAADALRSSEARFRRLAEHGAIGIWEVATDGRTIYANTAMLDMLEVRSAEELRGTHYKQFFTPEGFESLTREHAKRQRGEHSVYETEIVGARGGRRIAVVSGAPMLTPGTPLTSLIGTFTDITDRKRDEERLRLAEARYRALFEQSPYGILIVDPEHAAPVQANAAALRMLGDSEQELRNTSLVALEAEGSGEPMRSHIDRILARGSDEFETRLRTRPGQVIDVAVHASVVDFAGTLRIQAIVRDITQRKRDAERRAAEERRNRLLIDQTPLAVIAFDTQRRVVEWNPAAERIFGYTAAEALGSTADQLIEPPAVRHLVENIWQALLAGTGGSRSTNSNITKDGRPILCEWYNTPLVNAQGTVIGVASLVQDVTEVKRLEDELRQSQKMEAIGLLAAGVAHDFSNLLTAISGFTSLARRTLSPQHPAVRSLDRVDEAADQAVGVTKALLTFSRGGSTEKGSVQLGAVVDEAARLLRRTLPANVELRTRTGSEPVWVHADTTQLLQVVMNLAINARDAMPSGGRVSISVGSRPGQGESFLSVEDQGTGMTPEVRARIFEPFFTTKPRGQGTGLGLAITHAIIKDHEGRIDVTTEPGRGSTFTVVLPQAKPPTDQPAGGAAQASIARGRGQTILLVSKHTFIRELMASTLQSVGYRVIQLPDLSTIAAAIQTHDPKVALIDLDGAPDNAHDEVKSLPRSPAGMRVIYLVSGVHSLALPPGSPDLVIAKPFQIHELAAAVSEALS